jgi:hypothetical protein
MELGLTACRARKRPSLGLPPKVAFYGAMFAARKPWAVLLGEPARLMPTQSPPWVSPRGDAPRGLVPR